MRALLVEDQEWEQERARVCLYEAGFEVDLATSKEAGLHFGRERPYDVAIVDLGLDEEPDASWPGLELISELRDAMRHFPILIWSGRSDWSVRLKGKEVGADAYLVKSPDMSMFIDTLKALVKRTESESRPRLNL